MMGESSGYALGYTEDEARRWAQQAAFFEELTADVLRRAGIRSGMRVLDLGCGVGDVSLLASRMVGASGAVLGIDRSPTSVETARRRATDFAGSSLATVQPRSLLDDWCIQGGRSRSEYGEQTASNVLGRRAAAADDDRCDAHRERSGFRRLCVNSA